MDEDNIKVFPVPIKDDLKLEIKNFSGKGWIYILNTLSQKIIVKEVDFDLKDSKHIDMTKCSAGIYSVIVQDIEKMEIIKVMKVD